ncbi:c-type cytochrome [Aromatoleum aromaticum]|uniref:c-type cytochrome n=1 Tax=Aromatoleum aromaticum TaxID=551760 RepID=UPI0005A181F6|nr:c-type cytochrome [Aromatoleum aromaticum]
MSVLVVLASASSSGAAGTALRGEEIYARCLACHALAYNRTGPRHCGLFGRRAGSLPDYGYSDAMRESGIVWDAATLDRFLAAPTRVVPGTTMGYAGIPDPAERAALIEWLRETSRPGTACPENP